jgi:hypothetical protein
LGFWDGKSGNEYCVNGFSFLVSDKYCAAFRRFADFSQDIHSARDYTPLKEATKDFQVANYVPITGELAGVTSATQMPDRQCSMVRFKAKGDNSGNVYIGGSGVTVPNGSTDTTSGFPLDAGEDTGWLPCDNINRFYRICDGTGDAVSYLAL